ncbi:hypothetical protein NLG97_g7739 [Lecanicillium saksenae]|uniref:Uncharacterized protein n=1 Tax=Lecanicillium saksenae TaxID=468837 RepID=A0ACC1QMS5_9HYPO|nr:hypothetical protein NLG97_g7739 [Lecanicillium saksenae]
MGAAGIALPGRLADAAGGKRPKIESQSKDHCQRSALWLFSTFAPCHSPAPLPKRLEKSTIGAFARRVREPAAASTQPATEASSNQTPRSESRDLGRSTGETIQPSILLPAQAPRSRQLAPRQSSIAAETTENQGPSLLDKDQLLSLVSGPVEGTVAELFETYRDPFRSGYAAPDGPHIRISNAKQDVSFPTEEDMHRTSAATQATVEKLCKAVWRRLRYREHVSLERIFATYQELPEPRMLNLTAVWRSELLRVMGLPKKRDETSMLRYFSLVADVKNAGLTLNGRQWNYALAFATKYTSRIRTRQFESAMRLWSEMEREGNQSANEVTFNILFDAASKSGNFTLADMLYKEMEDRGYHFNRFHHISVIYYFGLQRDADGVRAAYKEMVEAGELVDAIALNAVIVGLLRSGEEGAAEDTYRRMRAGGQIAPKQPETNYMVDKAITKALIMLSAVAKQHPSLKSNFQRSVRISPGLRTFKLFIEHYAVRVGNLGKVVYFLEEMKSQGIPLHPTVFLQIFQGFFVHGGHPGSEWSEQRLDSVVNAFYQAQDEMGAESFHIDKWVVIWLLKAVKRCSSQQKLESAFDKISARWDVPIERRMEVLTICDKIVGRRDDVAAWRIFESTVKLRQMLGDKVII